MAQANHSSEKEQDPMSTEDTARDGGVEKLQQYPKVDIDEVLHRTGILELKEQSDPVQAQGCASEDLERDAKTEQLEQGDGIEKPVQSGTSDTPEDTNKLHKDKPQENDNSNKKRLRFGPSQRNKSGPRAKNGSYYNYYKRRYNGIHGDDRLPIVRDAVKLQGKDISLLDIGCNDGTVTIEMASLGRCIKAVGVDIDPNLVGAARKKLKEFVEKEASKSQVQLANPNIQGRIPKSHDTFPLSLRRSLHLMKEAKKTENKLVTDAEEIANENDAEAENCKFQDPISESKDSSAQFLPRALHMKNAKKETESELEMTIPKFPYNVTFRREDFAQKEPTRTSQELGKYDVVLCLSVTKWVHFAGGDDALKRLFRRLHACLKPGGVLILEPQPQKSYKSAIRKGLGKRDLKGERKLLPPKFPEYLTKTVGFSKMRMLRDVRHRGQAFNRPIMAFYKHQIDNEGDEQHQSESQNALAAPDAPDSPNRQQGAESNGMTGEDIDRDAKPDAKEEGEDRDGIADPQMNNSAGVRDDQEMQDMQENDRTEPRSEAILAGPSKAEGSASAPETATSPEDIIAPEAEEKDEAQLANGMKPSSSGSGSKAAVLPASGSKRRSTGQDVDDGIAQSPKRSKTETEQEQNETKSHRQGSSD